MRGEKNDPLEVISLENKEVAIVWSGDQTTTTSNRPID
jgi:hypothetical protein